VVATKLLVLDAMKTKQLQRARWEIEQGKGLGNEMATCEKLIGEVKQSVKG